MRQGFGFLWYTITVQNIQYEDSRKILQPFQRYLGRTGSPIDSLYYPPTTYIGELVGIEKLYPESRKTIQEVLSVNEMDVKIEEGMEDEEIIPIDRLFKLTLMIILSEVQTLLLLSARWHHAEMHKCEVPGLTICAVGGSSPLSLSLPFLCSHSRDDHVARRFSQQSVSFSSFIGRFLYLRITELEFVFSVRNLCVLLFYDW
jgi:hypothetical protein